MTTTSSSAREHRSGLVDEERLGRPRTVRFRGCEELERAPAVAFGRGRLHGFLARAVHDQNGAAVPARVREQDRSRGAHLQVERRRRCPRPRVEQDGDFVARRILQLLDHQARALGGRAPMDAAQRFALLVVAHAVQVEAARLAHQQPPALGKGRTDAREEAVELDQPRVDENRGGGVQVDLRAGQAERVLEHRGHLLELVAAAGERDKQVVARTARAGALQPRHSLAELRDPLAQHQHARRRAATR